MVPTVCYAVDPKNPTQVLKAGSPGDLILSYTRILMWTKGQNGVAYDYVSHAEYTFDRIQVLCNHSILSI